VKTVRAGDAAGREDRRSRATPDREEDIMIDFGGDRVVLTGAAGGVGSALVKVLSACGARVVACDREGTDLTAEGIVERYHFDLLDDTAVADTAAQIKRGEPPAAVISNAGWTRAETLADVTTETLDREMDLNFRSAALLTSALLPLMRNRSSGAAFVFVSSVNALSHCGNPAYSAAKAALNAWMRAIATEEGKNGVRANAVVPGSIRTGAWDHRIAEKPDILAAVSRLYPLGRLVEPAEVARAAAFLASPAASGITGVTLNVDAGLMAGNLPFLEQISS
jgi:NAD(P)-dependent dehydrogenase (short-subunit alcohol dehydrogenase family)